MRALSILVLLAACDNKDTDTKVDNSIAAFGNGSVSSVTLSVIGTGDDGLDVPRDLEFNPDVEGELWVVNRADDSTTIFHAAGTSDQDSEHIVDPYALHFMEEVSSIAFGGVTYAGSDARTFGTCQESRNTYNGFGSPNDFMGPSLWTADLDLYGKSNPEAVEYLTQLFGQYADLGSHLDMLHESPLCMGMAWDYDNVYWVFDGSEDIIVRYDFAEDHDLGYDDHSDGIISRYIDADVSRVEDVPSHMVLDPNTGLLYTADTGNNRITVLDTTTGEEGDSLRAVERGTDHHEWVGADYSTLVSGSDVSGMDLPSGIALHDDILFVSDNQNGMLLAFNLNGKLLDSLDLELDAGALMGIEVVGLDDIWVTDAINNEILRIQP